MTRDGPQPWGLGEVLILLAVDNGFVMKQKHVVFYYPRLSITRVMYNILDLSTNFMEKFY